MENMNQVYIKKSQSNNEVDNENQFVFRWDFIIENEDDQLEKHKYIKKIEIGDKTRYIYEERDGHNKRDHLYKISSNRIEIIKPYEIEKNIDYYNQFVNKPEEAIRFIISKYEKESVKRQTVCEGVLSTNIIENGITRKVIVNLSHKDRSGSGIVHAVEDHYETHIDFDSPKEMSDKIREILENVDNWSEPSRYQAPDSKNKEKGDYKIVLSKIDDDHYFVRTIFNFKIRPDDKKRDPQLDRESFLDREEAIEVNSVSKSDNSLIEILSQSLHKDNNNTSNKQVFNKNFMNKSENSMTIFEYLKSKITNKISNDIIIKGISYRQVENGWIPNIESISILEKGKRAQIGEIREWKGGKYRREVRNGSDSKDERIFVYLHIVK